MLMFVRMLQRTSSDASVGTYNTDHMDMYTKKHILLLIHITQLRIGTFTGACAPGNANLAATDLTAALLSVAQTSHQPIVLLLCCKMGQSLVSVLLAMPYQLR